MRLRRKDGLDRLRALVREGKELAQGASVQEGLEGLGAEAFHEFCNGVNVLVLVTQKVARRRRDEASGK